MKVTRWVSMVVVGAMGLAACGGGTGTKASGTNPAGTNSPGGSAVTTAAGKAADTTKPTTASTKNAVAGGKLSDAALAAVAPDGDADPVAVDSIVQQVAALPVAQQDALRADLSLRLEQEVARVSGLEAAVGSPQATTAALQGAWAQISTQLPRVDAKADLTAAPKPGKAHLPAADQATSQGTAGGTGVIGVFMGMMAMGMVADPVVSAANGMEADAYSEGSLSAGSTVSAAVEQSTLELEYHGTDDGVTIDFTAVAVVHPCPKADGSFDAQLKLEVKTAKGTAGANVTIDVDVTGTVDDDAELASSSSTTRTQWAGFDAGKGQYVDLISTRSGNDFAVKATRAGGQVTPGFVQLAVLLGEMFSVMTVKQYVEASEKAWQSGRCVKLGLTASPGPSGLKPSSTATVSAKPRSKVDGSPTGGTVTAKLSAGGTSVAPSGSKVAADADFTYTAPDERDKSGTVAAESRSKRGVGKADITLDTKQGWAYQIVGGLDDFQTNTAVCDVTQPFTLSGGGVTVNFSGGLTGTYTYSGVFNSSGNGTYTITLPDGPGKPGTMTGQGPGQAMGATGSGTETYTLTPLTSCGG